MIYNSILEATGNTPIVKLNRIGQGVGAQLYAKIEFVNPGGSIKDRIALHMIEDAERKGLLKPGGTIVEGTSGNTGVGLAIVAAIKGYKCIFVMPDKMSFEKIKNLRAFGAKVVITPTAVEADDPKSYYQVSRRLARETPNAHYLNQYDNLANREAHYQTTGPEILKQMPDIDVFIAGIGTGGTICGVGRYLKEKKPTCEVVAVDPVGSIVYDYFKEGKIGTAPKTYKIEGIGEDFIPKNYDLSVVSDMVQVEDKESYQMTRTLVTREGIYAGVSSGAATIGALKWIKSQGARLNGKKVLIVFPDSGNRYLSKAFDDEWMREAGFLDEKSLGKVSDLLLALGRKQGDQIVMAKQNQKVSSVIELMREKGISQLPVCDDGGWIKGIVSESSLLSALFQNQVKASDPVEMLADPSIEFVTPEDPIEKVTRLVTAGKTPLVHEPGSNPKLLAIITKIDLLSFLGK